MRPCPSARLLLPLFVLLTVLVSIPVSAQSIQAYRSAAVSADSVQRLVAVKAEEVSRRLAAYDLAGSMIASRSEDDPDANRARSFLPMVDRERELARDALAATDRPSEFFRRYEILRAYDDGIARASEKAHLSLSAFGADPNELKSLAAPTPLFKVPDVVFVIGTTMTIGQGKAVGQAEFSTNLLGAAAGTAFDAMGSDALKEYFQDNLAVGTAFPFGGRHKLTAALGVGLGGLKLGRFAIWPAINIEQVDSGDARVPSAIRAGSSSSANWSSPILSIAVSPWDLSNIAGRVQAGRLTPVFTAAVRLPYYYPNDPFSAVAALFSDKRGDYQKSGKLQFQVGVFFPLQKVKPVAATTP